MKSKYEYVRLADKCMEDAELVAPVNPEHAIALTKIAKVYLALAEAVR